MCPHISCLCVLTSGFVCRAESDARKNEDECPDTSAFSGQRARVQTLHADGAGRPHYCYSYRVCVCVCEVITHGFYLIITVMEVDC